MTDEKELGCILSVVKRHNQFYETKLADLVQEDTIPSYFRDDKNNGSVCILFGQMLVMGKWWIPWEKLVVRHDKPKEYMTKVLQKLGLRRFFDEDAPGQGLLVTEDEFGKKAICFVNPDFPKGYWENHTLEGKLDAA